MLRRTGLALIVLLAALVPGAAAREEAADAAPALTPWAAVRRTLPEAPLAFRGDRARSLHARAPAAIEAALRWLAAHQSPDGRWEAAGFGRWCDGAEVPEAARAHGRGLAIYDVGVTGLALSAFLVAGHTGEGKHEFDATVRKGLTWLKGAQDAEGCFGERVVSPVKHADPFAAVHVAPAGRPGHRLPYPPPSPRETWVYNHAAATIAMVEAFGLTDRDEWKESAQRGLDLITLARNPYLTWRYGIKPGDNDTSVTGWMMLVLDTARRVDGSWREANRPLPLRIDEEAFDGIRAWIDKMTDPDYGRTGYQSRGGVPARPAARVDRFPPERSEATTAIGMLARLLLGEDPRSQPLLRYGLQILRHLPPTWNEEDGSIDMVYWHFGTLAVHQYTRPRGDGPLRFRKDWAEWLHQVEVALVEHQRSDGEVAGAKGSWDPVGVWGSAGGRVYATALNTLTLLTPVRFDRRAR